MDEDEIRLRLTNAIFAAASGTGRTLGDGNQHLLPTLAAGAAAAIVASTSEGSERDARVREGEKAYRALIAAMAEAAESLDGYPPGLLGEQTFALAQQARGPFPPFW